ncbi:hypothetical protein [Natrinema salaciae]|uniref:hypothetical protein n=1 Tax=Natrinema salaciae TaxID=1186196 RepID=UPI0015879724|nr:hypothetical protein [Natrinema salaciae]
MNCVPASGRRRRERVSPASREPTAEERTTYRTHLPTELEAIGERLDTLCA